MAGGRRTALTCLTVGGGGMPRLDAEDTAARTPAGAGFGSSPMEPSAIDKMLSLFLVFEGEDCPIQVRSISARMSFALPSFSASTQFWKVLSQSSLVASLPDLACQ